MPQTPAAAPNPDTDLRQLTAQVRTAAVKIKAGADQILLDLAHGRLVRSAARNLAAEVFALGEAQAALAQAEKAAARQQREAAA